MAFILVCFSARVFIAAFLALLLLSSFAASQQTTPDDTRGLKPREYAERIKQKVVEKRPRSKRARPTATALYVPATNDTSPVGEGVDVGVTFWRLRESVKSDNPASVEPTRIAKRKKGTAVESAVKLTPTRATSETHFSDGDLLRLTIEVPFESYIYILNTEQYADGSVSDPYMVFPSREDVGRNAKGVPGRLIFIPNEIDQFEITRLNPDGPERTAEIFIVLLRAQPVEELPPLQDGEENRRIDPQQLERWQREWGGRVLKFEKAGGVGTAITRAEKKAGPLGGELLTEADPEPQTVYHIARKTGEPLLFTIPVRVRK